MDVDRPRLPANRNYYRLLRISWALAQISCYLFNVSLASNYETAPASYMQCIYILRVSYVYFTCKTRNQLATACAQRQSQKVNQATLSLSHSPVKAPVPVRTHCTNAWWNRCKTDLNSFPRRKLEETTGTSSYYMDENHSAGSEIQRPHYGRRSWPGSEPSTLEIDVYVRRYALLVVLARNDDDDDVKLCYSVCIYYSITIQHIPLDCVYV